MRFDFDEFITKDNGRLFLACIMFLVTVLLVFAIGTKIIDKVISVSNTSNITALA